MKKLYVFFCLVLALSASAQITFTRADYGVAGDKVFYNVDTPAILSLSAIANITGTAKIWNFLNGAVVNKYDSVIYVPPSFAPNPPAGANLLVVSTNNSQQFENVDTNFVQLILDQPQYNITGLSLKVLKFPFIYGSALLDSVIYTKSGIPGDFNFTSAQVYGADSLRFDISAYATTTATGFGLVEVPDTNCMALQVNTTKVFHNVISVHGSLLGTGWVVANQFLGVPIHEKTVNVQWLAKNLKSFIAQAVMDTNGVVVQSFTYWKKTVIPKITLVTPDNGQRGQTLNVTISGTNTHFTQATSSGILFSQGSSTLTVNSINIVNDTAIVASLTIKPTDPLGYYDVKVTNPADTLILNSSFRVKASTLLPAITLVTPSFGSRGQTLNVTISGTNTHFTQASSSGVLFSQGSSTLTVNSISKTNDSIIVASLTIKPTDSLGYYNVKVTDPADNTLTLNSSFQVKASALLPAITLVTPSFGSRGQTLNVTISGTNTHFTQTTSSSGVLFSQGSSTLTINSISKINDSTIVASLILKAADPLGYYDVKVTDPADNTLTLNSSFQVKASILFPSLINITPVSALRGQTLNISISGFATHFTHGPDSVMFYYGGSPAIKIKVNSMTIINDSLLNSSITIDSTASAGSYDIYVKDSVDGTLSLGGAFSVISTGPGTAINEAQYASASVLIYPNPANDMLNIAFTPQSSFVTIRLFDITGRNVKSITTSDHNLVIDVTDLNNGIYLCTIKGKDFTASRKIMINK